MDYRKFAASHESSGQLVVSSGRVCAVVLGATLCDGLPVSVWEYYESIKGSSVWDEIPSSEGDTVGLEG